ncbi:Fc.00g026310.m01.CDS01 [Cosmosporella sp. VM-42]
MQARKGSFIVTGGTAGLGYWAALQIAKSHPDYLVVLSSRSDKDKAADTINKTLGQDNVIFLPLDLSNLANVRKFVKNWEKENYPPIQGLALNAALQFPGALTKTVDDIEATFGISHVGHALLFHLLWPHLTENARIAITSSGTHDPAQKSGLPDAKYTTAEDLAHPPTDMVKVEGRQRYASTKLANILWTYALNRHFAERSPRSGVTVNAFDPGLMPGTGLAREAGPVLKFIWLHVLPHLQWLLRLLISPNIHTPEESGTALARLVVSKDVKGVSGKYYEGIKQIESSKDSHSVEKQEDLWQWTTKYLAQSEDEQTRFRELK